MNLFLIMKKIILAIVCILLAFNGLSQNVKKIYDEEINAVKQIEAAVQQAANTNKYVVCQVGGNWCPWCLRFADFITKDTAINQVVSESFIYIHVNYSKNNKNPEAMAMLGNPARFGFPVLVVLDEKGNVIHIQDSALLEENEGYNAKKVLSFFKNWTPEAVRGN